jgi:signal-transduction protein with cAMP-binding, CBS, and nucleotidyltransferase domain
MSKTYAPLPSSGLVAGADFHRPAIGEYPSVGLEDPAEKVMTDFKRLRAFTVQATTSVESANNKMIANGVRLLLVVDIRNHVIGLITSTDILGEKPVRVVEESGIGHNEVLVGDIMTPREQLEAIDMKDLVHARVGHVVATLQAVGRRHALIVETEATGRQLVRGLFSATQVEKQLGMAIATPENPRGFARVGEPITR